MITWLNHTYMITWLTSNVHDHLIWIMITWSLDLNHTYMITWLESYCYSVISVKNKTNWIITLSHRKSMYSNEWVHESINGKIALSFKSDGVLHDLSYLWNVESVLMTPWMLPFCWKKNNKNNKNQQENNSTWKKGHHMVLSTFSRNGVCMVDLRLTKCI